MRRVVLTLPPGWRPARLAGVIASTPTRHVSERVLLAYEPADRLVLRVRARASPAQPCSGGMFEAGRSPSSSVLTLFQSMNRTSELNVG
jgi:hypothetical protein